MQRDINPVFRHTFVFRMLGRGDVLGFTLKDTGLFSKEHLGGTFGPKVVADCSLPVGTDFDGYLEMSPCKEGFSQPVLKVVARFPLSPVVDEMPPEGLAAAMVGMFGPTCSQAMASAPSAPCALDEVTGAGTDPIAVEKVDEKVNEKVDVGMLGRLDVGKLAGLVVEKLGGQDVAPVSTSSPFFIDPEVFDLAAPNLILQHMAMMQGRRLKWPFPVGGLRNYDCFAAGFQPLLGDWAEEHIWGPIPESEVPVELIDQVSTRLEPLQLKVNCGGGVGTLVKLFGHLKARCVSNCPCHWWIDHASITISRHVGTLIRQTK